MSKKFLIDEFEKGLSLEIKEVLLECSKIADDNGFKIYLIGGAVRDFLLGREVFDVDVIVEGDAVRFAQLLKDGLNAEIICSQEELRTAKVIFPKGVNIDFASTRCESYPASGELPLVQQSDCTLEEDVERRDFTVNTMAIALNGSNWGEFIDYLSGFDDLNNKIIRVLHDKSFIDDPSRIVRGLKFAIRLGFELDKNTLNLQNDYLAKVNKKMPLERIRGEVEQLFNLNSSKAYDDFIKQKIYLLITDSPNLETSGEEIKNKISLFEIQKNDTWFVYLACLLIFETFQTLQRLNLSSKQINIIMDAKVLFNSRLNKNSDKYCIYKFFREKNLISLIVYYILTNDESVFTYVKELKAISLLISGDDLIALGLEPSSRFKDILDKVLEEKINNKLATKEDEINFAKQYL